MLSQQVFVTNVHQTVRAGPCIKPSFDIQLAMDALLTMDRGCPRAEPSGSHSPSRQTGPLGPKELLRACEAVYAAFVPAQVTVDTHLENTLARLNMASEDDACFISQVFYGMVRYKKFLSCLLDSFYYHNSGTALRNDANKYSVFGYLAVFRLEELTFPQFRRLVQTQDAQKMLVFLQYLFDEGSLHDYCREDWLKVYDKQFVDSRISGLLSWSTESGQLLAGLEQQVYFTSRKQDGEASSTSEPGSAPTRALSKTVIRPFNLTQPRPKPQPVDPPIPPAVKGRPPPKRTEGPTAEQRALEAARALNRKAVEAKYSDPNCQPFKLRVAERPTHTERLRQEAEEQLAAELAKVPQVRPVPPPPMAEVKLNAAAILREDALYKKKQAQEAAELQRFESELRDTSRFEAWQAQMRAADEAVQQERIEQLRAQMSTAQGAAIQARSNLVAERLREGERLKDEREQRSMSAQKQRAQEASVRAAKREQIVQERALVQQAQERQRLERRLTAEEVRKKAADDAKAVAEQEAKDMAEKRDIIQQLRALERAPKQRFKTFDPTAIADLGMNDQMSLAELRARLAAAKQRQFEEEERARELILARKQEREAALLEKAASIGRIRRLASAQAQLRKADTQMKRAQSAECTKRQQDAAALELHARLEAKHAAAAAERARIAAEEKRVKFEQMQSAAGAAVVEENKFRELREGAKRAAKDRQVSRVSSAVIREATLSRAQGVRQATLQQQQRQRSNFLADYDAKVADLTQHRVCDDQSSFASKTNLVQTQHIWEAAARAQHATAAYKPFAGVGVSTMQARLQALSSGQEL